MRTPTAPDVSKMMEEPAKLGKLIAKIAQPDVQKAILEFNDRYYHWDKIRYIKLPNDITRHEMWMGLKFYRFAGKQALPLTFTKEQKFYHVLTQKHLECLHNID